MFDRFHVQRPASDAVDQVRRTEVRGSFTPLDILLPADISFNTFRTLSYTIDIHSDRLTPARSFVDFALHVNSSRSWSPTHRSSRRLLAAMRRPRRPTFEQNASGAMLCLLGLWQKVALADGLLAAVVEAVYQGRDPVGFYEALAGTLTFAGQIFFDFSGYSSIAIRAARCLGFDLAKTINSPVPPPASRFLAPLAHVALDLASRLLVHPARGQPAGIDADTNQPDGDDATGRVVAWCLLELHPLGGCMAGF